jgi:hypothetical protein
MADNVQLPITGTGTADTVVATDDVASVHYPFVKIADGTLGGTEKAAVTATNGLDVDVTRVSEARSSDTTTTWTSATAQDTALTLAVSGYETAVIALTPDGGTCSAGEIAYEATLDGSIWFQYFAAFAPSSANYSALFLDGYDGATESEVLQFNVAGLHSIRWRLTTAITGSLSLALRARTSTGIAGRASTNQAVVTSYTSSSIRAYGYDGSASRQIKTDAAGELQVDVLTLPALAAGTANIGDVDVLTLPNVTIGTMAALVAGSANIGDVDVLTVPAPLSTTGGGTEATALRVTLANDSTGLVSVDDNGGALTVDNAGTFAVQETSAGASTVNSTSSDGGTALTATAQVIKGSAGSLCGYYIYNPNTTAQFVQFYNTAAASVTVGTTNPLFMLTIPAGSAANLWMFPSCIAFGTAMSWAATSTAGGNGAPSTALDAVAWYK